VVVLLSLDFWNTRVGGLLRSLRLPLKLLLNVAGRTLVGLRYWNEVDDEGESSWVFESRDVGHAGFPKRHNFCALTLLFYSRQDLQILSMPSE
jgi:hypothetical protein